MKLLSIASTDLNRIKAGGNRSQIIHGGQWRDAAVKRCK